MESVSSFLPDDHRVSTKFDGLFVIKEERGDDESSQSSVGLARSSGQGDEGDASQLSDLPRTAAEMVDAARVALQHDCAYSAYRQMLARLLSNDDHFAEPRKMYANNDTSTETTTMPSFVPNLLAVAFEETNVLQIEELETSVLVDDWIEELLRFLALKVLVDDVPPMNEGFVGESRDDSEEESMNRTHVKKNGSHLRQQMADEVRELKLMEKKARASKHIRNAWRSLLLLPVTYSNVCKALGSSVVEFNDYRSAKEKAASRRDEYQWTLQSYQILFCERPPVLFWPLFPLQTGASLQAPNNDTKAIATRDEAWSTVNDETGRRGEENYLQDVLGVIGKRLADAAMCMVTCGGTDNICSDYHAFRHTSSEDDYGL